MSGPFEDGARVAARKLPAALASIAVALMLAYGGSLVLFEGCGSDLCQRAEAFLHLDREANLPTWFSSTCWLVAAAFAGIAATRAHRMRGHWWGVAALCVFLSMDEAAMFHDRFGHLIGEAVETGDAIGYTWQIYGAAVIVLAALVFASFLWRLPRATSGRILLAGAIYVSGAMGIEALGAEFDFRSDPTLMGQVLRTLQVAGEEMLEMAGVIVLIHAVLHHLSRPEG